MSYIIIFFVLAVILAPLFAMRPSKAAQRQIQCRDAAIALGFIIKVCDLPQTRRNRVRKVPVEQGVCYRLPFTRRVFETAFEPFYCVTAEQGLEWTREPSAAIRQAFEDLFPDLPADTVALELTAMGVGIYWRETEGAERVAELFEQMASLRAQVEQQ